MTVEAGSRREMKDLAQWRDGDERIWAVAAHEVGRLDGSRLCSDRWLAWWKVRLVKGSRGRGMIDGLLRDHGWVVLAKTIVRAEYDKN